MKHVFRAPGQDVTLFSDADRKYHNLARHSTIVEICGDDVLMEEMYQYCKEKRIVGYDTETTGLDFISDKIVLVQIGDWERQYLIWVDKTNPEKLLQVLTNANIVKIGLHLKFDLTFGLIQFGMVEARAKNVVDVMLTAQTILCGIYDNPGLTMKMSGMETQAKHWLGLAIPKALELRIGWEGWDPVDFAERIASLEDEEEIRALQVLRREKMLYAADDVCIPISLAHEHKPWIKYLGLSKIVNLENDFLPVLSDIEARGLPFNAKKWEVLAIAAEQGEKDARIVLDELFEVEVTLDLDTQGNATYTRDKKYTSPAQMVTMIREWMYDNCGVEVIATNEHYKEALERYGRLNPARIDLMFTSGMIPDPEVPGKQKKRGYPKMKDILHETWDIYKHFLPPDAFILADTDSKTLKFLKVIYTADAEAIAQDAEHLPSTVGLPPALVDPILTLRGYAKSASTYGRAWLTPMAWSGRVYTRFNQTALSTGRLSSSPNSMNFPADEAYRAAFEARHGHKMVGADYSQIEPRVIAHLSKDPTYMKVFWSELPLSDGFAQWCDESVTEVLDLYTEVGKEIGQIPDHFTVADTKGKQATLAGLKGRKQAKIANLGLGYGTGKKKFHFMLCIDTGQYYSIAEVATLFDIYWSAMRVMKIFLDASSDLTDHRKSKRKVYHPYIHGKEVTYAETLMDRKRFFTEENPASWTQGRNMPIQGTAGGDMLKQATIDLTHWCWENDIEGGVVNLIHDELLGEVREDQAEAFAKAMSYCMEKVGQELCPSVPITADAYIDAIWRKD